MKCRFPIPGARYEEGKKISTMDGLAAIGYILYYNLVAAFLPSGRHYIRQVNEFLTSQREGG